MSLTRLSLALACAAALALIPSTGSSPSPSAARLLTHQPTVLASTTTTLTAATRAPVTAKATSASALAARRDRVLDSLNYDWESLGYRIVFVGPRRGYLGTTSASTRTITIYVRSRHTDQDLRVTLAHELGHAVDLQRGTSAERAAYLRARGAAGTSWWPCSGCSDYESGAGDFAEVFAVWLAGATDYRSEVAPAPARLRAGQLVGIVD